MGVIFTKDIIMLHKIKDVLLQILAIAFTTIALYGLIVYVEPDEPYSQIRETGYGCQK